MCSGCRNLVGFCHLNSVYGGALQPLLSVLDHINKEREHCPRTIDTEICAEGKHRHLVNTGEGFLPPKPCAWNLLAAFIVYFRLH